MESDSSENMWEPKQPMRSTPIDRRLSKKSASQDRHGKVYPDLFSEQTIRAVTPETPPTTSSSAAAPDTASSFSPASPASQSTHRSKFSGHRREHSTSISNTDDEITLESRRRKSRARIDEAAETLPESSPNSFISKTRHRLGSIATGGSYSQKPQEDSISSIGFPSITQSPALSGQKEYRQRLTKPPSRNSSPPATKMNRQASGLQGGLVDPDTGKISSLMKITSGRMAGILFFKSSNSSHWDSGYCAINVASGSLIHQPNVRSPAQARNLISDLRGCSVRTLYDAEAQATYLKVSTASSERAFQLRPAVPETFDSWLAALLCWQPILPKELDESAFSPQATSPTESQTNGRRRPSESIVQSPVSIIKMGKLLLWHGSRSIDRDRTAAQRRISSYKQPPAASSPWQQINCTLHENGLLRLSADSDARVLSTTHLSQLSRYAVQQLDASVLDEEFCIAIYPQYVAYLDSRPHGRPMFLAFETRIAFEVWFVLLRAFTVPELFSPGEDASRNSSDQNSSGRTRRTSLLPGMFRIERSLSVRLIDARFLGAISSKSASTRLKSIIPTSPLQDHLYAEIQLDDLPKARTAVKTDIASAIWGERFHFTSLPHIPSNTAVLVKVQDPAEREWTMTTQRSYDLSQGDTNAMAISGHIEVSAHDKIYGKLRAPPHALKPGQATEQRWPIHDHRNAVIGDMLTKIHPEETIVLMTNDYAPLSHLLHNFSNGLTIKVAQMLHSELVPLSEILVDIFQVSGGVSEWLMNLVEDEIDGLQSHSGVSRELPSRRMRYSSRIQSNDSSETLENREMLLRDASRSATVEANLLFRGNSLLTKGFDAHMRRLGKEYLQETIGERLRDIAESNPDCEVDPSKIQSLSDIDRNWRNLIALTSTLWNAISGSASRCPLELRLLFRHVQACAHDRYGDWIRSVKYSSVSGFLFLRFFCPAILNPKLFGLIKDHPRTRARRTFTLLAKSLQGLANMTTFGNKEPWMDPMNIFIGSSKVEFRTFIDQICAVPLKAPTKAVSPSYATPIQILGRLPATAREGFPSLPYLIDSAQRFANLVSLWLHNCPLDILEDNDASDALHEFHNICIDTQRQTRECSRTTRDEHGQSSETAPIADMPAEPITKDVVQSDVEDTWKRPSRSSTGTTFGSNELNGNQASDVSDISSRNYEHDGSGSDDDTMPSSSVSANAAPTRLPFSRLRLNEAQDSATSSKSSSTLSFHRPFMGRDRPSYTGMDSA